MALDPSIIGGIRPIQLANPLEQYAQVAQLQNMGKQNRLADLAYGEKQRAAEEGNALRTILSDQSNYDADGNLTRAALPKIGGVAPGQYGTYQKQFTEQQKSQREAKTAEMDQHIKTLDLTGRVLGTVRDEQGFQMVMPLLKAIGAPVDSLTFDPAAIKQLSDMALTRAQQMEQEWKGKDHQLNVDKFDYQQKNDTDNRKVTVRGQNLTDARGRESNALSRERLNFDKTQPRGQVVQTDQGPMIVDTRVGTGKQITGPDGNPVGPKLKDLPAPIAKAHMENQASLRKIDQALAAIDAYPDALGASNYLGDAIRQRSDPKGVEARALVADVGSLKVHDRSGAAVTAAETPRLRPFIPTDTDRPETAKRKLALFKQEYEAINNDIAATYGKDQGYKAPTATAPAKAGPASAAPKPGAVMDGYRFKGGNPADQNAWEKV